MIYGRFRNGLPHIRQRIAPGTRSRIGMTQKQYK
jgi:hypothetical protein